MKDITILGAGEAGLTFADQLRSGGATMPIHLIDGAVRFWNKQDFIASLSVKDWFDRAGWCKDRNIDFICDRVERVSLSRKKIYFKEHEIMDFDVLVVATGIKSKALSAKGEHREGVLYFSKIEPFEAKNLLKISNEIVVYALTVLGIRLSLALRATGKEVRIIGDTWDFLGSRKEELVRSLQERNIPVHLGVSLEELIGEGQVRATKIAPLKVFSSQLVFIDSGFTPCLDFFDEPVSLHNTIETSFEGVYVLGDANRPDIESEYLFCNNTHDAREQANILARALLEEKKPSIERKQISIEEGQKILEELLISKDAQKTVVNES